MLPNLFLPLLFAIVLAALLVLGLGWRRPGREEPGGALLFMFLVLFFGLWAAAVWVEPVGPAVWGVSWVPLVLVGLMLALLMLAAIPPPVRARPAAPHDRLDTASTAAVGLGVFFWMLLLFLMAVAIAGTWR